jgi:hypothetical protein
MQRSSQLHRLQSQDRRFHLHVPLLKVVLSVMSAYGLALWLHGHLKQQVSLSWAALPWVLAGSFYTHVFEFVYHNVAMHRSIQIGRWRFHDKRHLRHHQVFSGRTFQTRQPDYLKDVATHWYTVPVLLLLHYLVFLACFPARHAPWFFLGVSLQFLTYEITHWFTHVEDNAFDRLISRLPVLSGIRAAQIRHHRQHHSAPAVNFNFTPPYLGDRLSGTFSR